MKYININNNSINQINLINISYYKKYLLSDKYSIFPEDEIKFYLILIILKNIVSGYTWQPYNNDKTRNFPGRQELHNVKFFIDLFYYET